jgi:uncharacterized membrane protein YgdD (TMEM256/DUF423 family)
MTNHTLQKKLFQLSCILIGIAVILGAFGAHGLKDAVSETYITTFKTGVHYQFIHSFGILILALSLRRLNQEVVQLVYKFFLAGIIMFSGSLYLIVLIQALHIENNLGVIGLITPLGGLCFISGWFFLAVKGYKQIDRND